MTIPGAVMNSTRRHLINRLNCLAHRVQALVRSRQAEDPRPLDPFRGLYMPDRDLPDFNAPLFDPFDRSGNQEFVRLEEEADEAEAAGEVLRLRRLAMTIDLIPSAVEILLVALAPDVDRRFEPHYGYLHNDVTRRRATVGLALELVGLSTIDATARALLRPGSSLIDEGVLQVEEPERPFLTRSLRVPDRVVQHLLGDDTPDPAVLRYAPPHHPRLLGDAQSVARAMGERSRLCYLQEQRGAGTAMGLAVEVFRQLGREAVAIDLERVPGEEIDEVIRAATLEAKLRCCGLVAGPANALAERGPMAVRKLTEVHWPVIVCGSLTWDPAWSRDVPLVVCVPAATRSEREAVWRAVLDGACPLSLDPCEASAAFRLGPVQVARAATSAWIQSGLEGRDIGAADLQAGARAQNASMFERLARRIEPRSGWEDLIVAPDTGGLLRDLIVRVQRREVVRDSWGMASAGRLSDGVTALFAGPPGTGKTTAAEVIASELSFDLYTVNLATVVDKYIGETEKNLERIFDAAEHVNGVLFFDEADALFGKRSDVKDARDRYANVEVAYLLQRMEAFDGVAILATNLRANLDDGFTRRLDTLVEFSMPDEDQRLRLWKRFLESGLPIGEDIDLAFCSQAFKLSGGDICNIALSAAFIAANDGERPVTMADVVRATQREYRKLGRLCVEAEFGPYFHLLAEPEIEKRNDSALDLS